MPGSRPLDVAHPARLGPAGLLEALLGATMLAAAGYQLWFVLSNGYFAQPFFYDTLDTLMDFHNTAYWAHADGAYSIWNSIYPPLSFALLQIITPAQCYTVDGFVGRDCNPSGLAALLAGPAALAVVVWRHTADLHVVVRVARLVAIVLGLPMLFGLERGNLVLWAAPAAAWALLRVRFDWTSALALAVAINLKPYLLLLLLPVALVHGLRAPVRVLAGCAAVYAASVLIVGDGMPWHLLSNMQSFVGEGAINYWEKFYYSTSFSPLLRTLTSELPVHNYLDGAVIDVLIVAMQGALRTGLLMLVVALAATAAVPRQARSLPLLGALVLAAALCATESFGGYTTALMTALVFALVGTGAGSPRGAMPLTLAVAGCYLLSVPFDLIVVQLREFEAPVWISGGEVEVRYGISVGQGARPVLMLLVQCLLSVACVVHALPHIRRRLRMLTGRHPDIPSNPEPHAL